MYASEAHQRTAAEEALTLARTQFDADLAHLLRVEQEAAATHADALSAVESRVAALTGQLAVAAEAEKARNVEAHGLRTELSSHLTALAQAREREADTMLELNSLRGEAALLAAERGHIQGELARLQAELAAQRQLVEDQANALGGYQRSILYHSRALILRARATMLGRRDG